MKKLNVPKCTIKKRKKIQFKFQNQDKKRTKEDATNKQTQTNEKNPNQCITLIDTDKINIINII